MNINIKVTDNAITEFKKAIQELNSEVDLMVRVSVQGGECSCSGFMYGLGFARQNEINYNEDIIEEFDGIKLVADKRSLLYLDRVTIDWIDDLDQRGFKFDNPNANKTCKCAKPE